MISLINREKLYQQIASLPDDVVEQITDFTLFVMERRHIRPVYAEWSRQQWQEFSLEQLLRDDDEIEYTFEDAQEIYQP